MDDYKQKKRAWNKARRKATRPFKGLAILCAPLALLMALAMVVVTLFHSTADIIFKAKTYRIVDEDPSAQYFTMDFDTPEAREEYENALCEQLEAEGAALLMNKDNTLPLAADSEVTLFNRASADIVYGGTGSGDANTGTAPTLKDALEDVGLTVNPDFWEFYTKGEGSNYKRSSGDMFSGAATHAIGETPFAQYTDALFDTVQSYGDAAIVVISRIGGEGADLPRDNCADAKDGNYLQLNDDERAVLAKVSEMRKAGTVKKVIVLVNSANAVQVDFLQDPDVAVDACLWIGDVGQTGVNAVGDILVGNVNPSGRLVDTYCYDNLSSPVMQNFGSFRYTNADEAGLNDHNGNYAVYQEGIYVGYRYYETRYEDYVMGTGNAGDYAYDAQVAYPFGFGLSYTDFAYSDMQTVYDSTSDAFSVSVKVTNTGSTAGKETVQIYAQTPYTDYDKQNGVEKASVTLCGFAKTQMLEPGASETLSIRIDKRDLASYDSNKAKTYILDEGTYYFTAAKNAHDAVNNLLAAKGFTPQNTASRMDAAGNAELVNAWEQDAFDATTYATAKNTGTEVTNQFDDVDINHYAAAEQQVTYLSRADWEGTFPKETASLYATDAMVKELADQRYDPADYETVAMPTLGAKNGMKLIELRGADYDDPRWETLLDQMTAQDMALVIGQAFHFTQPIESIQMPGTFDENGPQGLTSSLTGGVTTMCYTSEDIMAATFNVELMEDVGRCIGNDCLQGGVSALYGPGANIHRSPYSGRNFEYYSEDGFLSGKIGAAEVAGIQSKGVFVLMKHYALNDSESDRLGIGIWANEQVIRELYLKAFQSAVEDSKANGVMTSYTRYGCHWSGSHTGNLEVIRKEWGCNGLIISDNSGTSSYINGCDGVLAGSSAYDAMTDLFQYANLKEYTDDPVIVTAMREACHQIAYAVVNSNAMNGITEKSTIKLCTQTHVIVIRVLFAVFAAGFVVCTVLTVVRGRKFRKENPKPKK